MSDSAPPPPPPPPPNSPYGAPGGGYGAPVGPRPGELGERFLARFVDGIIIGVASFIILVILRIAIGGFAASALSAVIGAVIYVGYFAYLESERGQTIGKMAMSLHVVGPDGTSKPTIEQAAKRNLWTGLGILGIIPILGSVLAGLIELVVVILIAVGINGDPVRRQAWPDKFAGGTMVVKR